MTTGEPIRVMKFVSNFCIGGTERQFVAAAATLALYSLPALCRGTLALYAEATVVTEPRQDWRETREERE